MKIAFVYPEVYDIARFGRKRKEFPPFGVLYLATIASQQNGVSVKIFSVENIDEYLDLTIFDVVAFSIPSSVTYEIMKSVRFKSSYANKVLLAAGGVHAQIFPKKVLQDMDIDVVCTGQGDEVIVELLKKSSSKNLASIKGICFKDEYDIIRFSEPAVFKNNLNHLPTVPLRDLLPDSDFILTNRLADTRLKMTHIMLSQGCPFACNFCASQQRRMQYRAGWHIRSELKYLRHKYNIEGFAVVGDNFLVNKRKVREICVDIGDLNLKWSTLSRVDTIDYDILEIMADAGCIEIKYGVESGSATILKAMGKRISVDQIYNAIRMTHSSGIGVKVFIIHGYPGENMKTTQETIGMLNDLSHMIGRVSLFRFVPLPGSRIWDKLGGETIDMTKCHIHHNPYHWWGSDDDFKIVEKSYQKLDSFIFEKWG